MTRRKSKRAGAKPKFARDQVVMVFNPQGFQPPYPVKLMKPTNIGNEGPAWLDTLSNVEHEKYMRPLTKRERGGQ